ncbi:MAG: hypothetical protein HY886_10235 [Deltaproteobacteria bacterium]|nr:hypothetical protein [Deltaproteobacteria bacterium]
MQQDSMKNHDHLIKPLIVLMAASHLAFVIAGMFFRFIDGDEGGMLTLAKEVINGRVPILDINAHNQPVFYYLYGGWMKLFGFSIVSARSLSAIAVFAVGLILIWWTRRFTRNWLVTALVYLLYITSLTYFKTNIPVKPFALSNLFTFAGFALLSGAYLKRGAFGQTVLFVSGILLGLSMGVRLIFILPFTFALWIFIAMLRQRPKMKVKEIVKGIATFTVGTTIPILPAIIIFIKEPVRAYTIWAGAYAQIYLGRGNNPDFIIDVHGQDKTGMMLNGLREIMNVPDMTLLLGVFVASTIIFFIHTRRRVDKTHATVYLFAWMVFVSIVYVYSNLYGGYLGYVNQVVLFLCVLSVPLIEAIANRVGFKKLVFSSAVITLAVVAAFYVYYQRRLKTSIFYMLKSDDLIVTPAFVDKVSDDVIKKLTKPEDVVFDTWGAFVFASGRRPVKGFEYPTDNAFFWKLMPDREKARKYLYIPEPELFRMIEQQEIPLLVLGDPRELGFLLTGRYRADDQDSLNAHAEKRYRLYKKYFVKPTNAWLMFYVPKTGVTTDAG